MVGNLRLPQAVEYDPAAAHRNSLGAPDLVDALFGRCIRGIPPTVNGLHNGIAVIPLLCQPVGILPAAAEDKVIPLPVFCLPFSRVLANAKKYGKHH